ncbi:uncharacterized protein TNCV_5041881 [Trichonephila clavipes]|nr:uncharacterized protein TNCV_5041881 [Trichonephila clavipes]
MLRKKKYQSFSGSNEICVSGDGTWKTRGHTSRIGVCSVIGDVTGKVIDVAVLSSYCKGCEKWRGPKSGHSYEEWKLKHQPHCVKNHIGSSCKMEVDGMKEIFQRSVPQRNAKYIKYIGDGDTKTFQELQRTAPYSIEKVECVGHIQKRMGARLRKLKTMNSGKKLSDGVGHIQKRMGARLRKLKTMNRGKKIIRRHRAVNEAMKALGFKIGHFTVTSAFKANYARIKHAEIKSKSYTLEARRASRMRKKATNEHFAELEGPTYEAGSF